jgi:hypothetical protein
MLNRLLRRRRALVLLALSVGLMAMTSVSALAASGKQVKVADNYFGPKKLAIGRGTRQARGSYRRVFTKTGTYSLVCTIHKGMNMTLVVR